MKASLVIAAHAPAEAKVSKQFRIDSDNGFKVGKRKGKEFGGFREVHVASG
jgi:hypothetical protein